MYVRIYVHNSLYVYMYVLCAYVCYVCMYLHWYVCTYICMYVCMYICSNRHPKTMYVVISVKRLAVVVEGKILSSIPLENYRYLSL
jgi:hypothetical protein